MSMFDKLVGPAISVGGGLAAGAVDGEQAATAAKAGQVVTTPYSILGGILAGAAGIFGEKFLGKKMAEISVQAGSAMLAGGVATLTYQSTLKANGATNPTGTTGITATPATTTTPAVSGYRRGMVGQLPPHRGHVTGRELASAYAMLR